MIEIIKINKKQTLQNKGKEKESSYRRNLGFRNNAEILNSFRN